VHRISFWNEFPWPTRFEEPRIVGRITTVEGLKALYVG
jgi:hypothetical protein